MVNWMHYYEIQKFKRKGFSKNKTAEKIGINRETVGVYWDMSAKEFEERLESAKTREKKPDPHKAYVVECLMKYPDMSAAQLYD